MHQGFSDRFGITQSDEVIQADGMSDVLRVSIWNIIRSRVSNDFKNRKSFLENLGSEFLKVPIDDIPVLYQWESVHWFREVYGELAWFEVYNLIEFVTLDLLPSLYPPAIPYVPTDVLRHAWRDIQATARY